MKIKLISILLLLCMLLSSCATSVVNTSIPPKDTATLPMDTTQNETGEQPSLTKMPDSTAEPSFFEMADQILYPFPDMLTTYHGVEEYKTKGGLYVLPNFALVNKIEPDVPKTRIWNFNGVDYELVYSYSTIYRDTGFGITDVYVDYYKCADSKSDLNYVVFEHNTTVIREIEIEHELLFSSMDEHVEYVSGILDGIIDVSEYEVSCTTLYTDINGDQVNVDSFYNVVEGEKLLMYNLNFALEKDGILTGNLICYYFQPGPGKLAIRNFTWKEQYTDQLNITQSEIDYAGNLINEWIDEVSFEEKFQDYSSAVFEYVNYLYGKKFLVYSFTLFDGYRFGTHAKTIKATWQVYVDYERLQQKMALEGVKP